MFGVFARMSYISTAPALCVSASSPVVASLARPVIPVLVDKVQPFFAEPPPAMYTNGALYRSLLQPQKATSGIVCMCRHDVLFFTMLLIATCRVLCSASDRPATACAVPVGVAVAVPVVSCVVTCLSFFVIKLTNTIHTEIGRNNCKC